MGNRSHHSKLLPQLLLGILALRPHLTPQALDLRKGQSFSLFLSPCLTHLQPAHPGQLRRSISSAAYWCFPLLISLHCVDSLPLLGCLVTQAVPHCVEGFPGRLSKFSHIPIGLIPRFPSILLIYRELVCSGFPSETFSRGWTVH